MISCEHEVVLVFGAGVSGIYAARLACRKGAHRVCLYDGQDTESLRAATKQYVEEGGELYLGWKPADGIPGEATLAVVSPGIPQDSPMLQAVKKYPGCRVVSELEFGSWFCPGKFLAITGTNGKTTTVELLTYCLKTAGFVAFNGGNIGFPLSQLALTGEQYDYVVVEVSSYQLEQTGNFMATTAALLNLTPDHLARHGSLENYLKVKLALLEQVQSGSPVVINANLLHNPLVKERLADGSRRIITFSAEQEYQWADFHVESGALWGMGQSIMPLSELGIQGRHNQENALAVLALGMAADLPWEKFLPALRTFRTGDHRMVQVAEYNGIRFINDSKGTNVDATQKALTFFGEQSGKKILLIAGGIDKGCDLSEAKNDLRNYVKKVYLIGQCASRLAKSWGEVVPTEICDGLSTAVKTAFQEAVPGDVVLLSPACASQDMFRDYQDRGRQFEDCVKKL